MSLPTTPPSPDGTPATPPAPSMNFAPPSVSGQAPAAPTNNFPPPAVPVGGSPPPAPPENAFPPPQVAAVPPHASSLAIVTLILGIASLVLLSTFILGLLLAVTALTVGKKARTEIDASNGALTGRGMATAGAVLAYVSIGIMFLVMVIFVWAAIAGSA